MTIEVCDTCGLEMQQTPKHTRVQVAVERKGRKNVPVYRNEIIPPAFYRMEVKMGIGAARIEHLCILLCEDCYKHLDQAVDGMKAGKK